MPTIFEFYFYGESEDHDTWWNAAYESGKYRTEEEQWWNEVQWYDQMFSEEGVYRDIDYYLNQIDQRNLDFESIAEEINDEDQMKIFTEIMHVLAT